MQKPHIALKYAASEQALISCRLARAAEEAGDLEGARAQLANYWTRIGERPKLDGVAKRAQAEILLRVGSLAGKLGEAKRGAGAQEFAKDLLGESASIFQCIGQPNRAAEAQIQSAYCYLREGLLEEARIVVRESLQSIKDVEADIEITAAGLLVLAYIEREAKRHHSALDIHGHLSKLAGQLRSDYLRGASHNEYALTLRNIGIAEDRTDYLDRALIEFSGAAYHFERCGNERYAARVINNLGNTFLKLGKFDAAHECLEKARNVFGAFKDWGVVAQVDETRTRALLKQGRNIEALRIIRAAVTVLEEGDNVIALAEALTTYGVSLARCGSAEPARQIFLRATEMAQYAGDTEGAGQAWLSLLEESQNLSAADALAALRSARTLLDNTQDAAIWRRVLSSAERLIEGMVRKSEAADSVDEPSLPVSLPALEHEFEGMYLRRALTASGGHLTNAAKMLGLQRQTMMARLRHHPELRALYRDKREGESNLRQMFDAVRIDLPEEFHGKSTIAHSITTHALDDWGVRPGDVVVIVKGEYADGDVVGASVLGEFIVGELSIVGSVHRLKTSIQTEEFEAVCKVEGRVVGFCREADLKGECPAFFNRL